MIMELNKTDFYKCKNLLHQQGQLEVKAVVEGVNPGRIFVDNLTSPNAGLVWLGNNDGFIFIGNEENEQFNEQVDKLVYIGSKRLATIPTGTIRLKKSFSTVG